MRPPASTFSRLPYAAGRWLFAARSASRFRWRLKIPSVSTRSAPPRSLALAANAPSNLFAPPAARLARSPSPTGSALPAIMTMGIGRAAGRTCPRQIDSRCQYSGLRPTRARAALAGTRRGRATYRKGSPPKKTYPRHLPHLLRVGGERRKKEAHGENDREPDRAHGHLLGRAAGRER